MVNIKQQTSQTEQATTTEQTEPAAVAAVTLLRALAVVGIVLSASSHLMPYRLAFALGLAGLTLGLLNIFLVPGQRVLRELAIVAIFLGAFSTIYGVFFFNGLVDPALYPQLHETP